MPTPVFCCGAECQIVAVGAAQGAGLLKHWDLIVGTAPTSVAAAGRDGVGRAYRLQPTAATNYFEKTLTGGATVCVARVAFKFDTLPSVSGPIIQLHAAAGSATLGLRFRTGTNDVVPAIGSTITGATAFAITTGVWYIVDIKGDVGSTTRTASAKIQPAGGSITDLGTASATDTASTMDAFRAGALAAMTTDLYLDDMLVSLTSADYPLGDGRIVGLSPTSDGTHSFNAVGDFQYNGNTNMGSTSPTDTFTYIDDPLNNITDFLAVSGAAAGEYLEWLISGMPAAASINGVGVVSSHHSAGTTANKQTLRMVDGGSTDDTISDGDQSNTTITYALKHYATKPSGGAWTQAAINALKFRWTSSFTSPSIATVPYIDGLMLEVDYVPTIALTGTAAAATASVPAGALTLAVALAGAVAAAVAVVPSGALALGDVTLPGTAAAATATVPPGSLAMGGAALAGTAAVATAVVPGGTLAFAITLPGGAAAASGVVPAGALALGGVTLPGAAAVATATVPSGALALGGVSLAGTPAAATAVVPPGALAFAVTLPGAAASAAAVVPSGSLVANIALPGTSGVASAAVPGGALALGGVVLSGAPAVAAATAPAGALGASVALGGSPAVTTGVVPTGALSGAVVLGGTPGVASGVVPAGMLSLEDASLSFTGTPAIATAVVPQGALATSVTLPGTVAVASATVPPGALLAAITLPGAPGVALAVVPPGTLLFGGTTLGGSAAQAIAVVPPGSLALGVSLPGATPSALAVVPAGTLVLGAGPSAVVVFGRHELILDDDFALALDTPALVLDASSGYTLDLE